MSGLLVVVANRQNAPPVMKNPGRLAGHTGVWMDLAELQDRVHSYLKSVVLS